MSKKHLTRRNFLRTTALAASAPFILPSFVWGAETKASERINLGFIGVGRMGRGHLHNFLRSSEAQVVAICEVDGARREDALKTANEHYAQQTGQSGYSGVKGYVDFRELLARDDIDAVVIATPDHWHAIIAIAAARAGKDIYCEKPLCQSVEEARAMVAVVRETGRVFQTGSQQRSTERFRLACEWVRNGIIGDLQRITVALPHGIATWCDLPENAAPEGLDWNQWLGPAPERGWSEVLSPLGVHNHFPDWRKYREYGGGMITDWGAHHFDIAQWAMGMDESGPAEVIPPVDPKAETGVRLIYRNGVEVTHLDGNGITFFGSEGKVFVNRGTIEISPEEKRRQPLPENAIRLYKSNDHYGNWISCIRSREKPICDVEIGARTVTVCHLANMAYWHRQRFAWDPDKNTFFGGSGNPEWLRTSYRAPWSLASL